MQPLESLLPVLGQLDLVALEFERAPQRLPHGPFVFDHQDLHVRIVAPEGEICVRTPCKQGLLREVLANVQLRLRPA